MLEPILLDISSADRSLASEIGEARNTTHGHPGEVWVAGDQASGIRTHQIGALGELMIARWLGVPWDRALLSRSEWSEQYARLTDLCGLEIRTTRSGPRMLPIYPKDHGRPIYAYVYVALLDNFERAQILGFMEYPDAVHEQWTATVATPLRGVSHAVPQHALKDAHLLRSTMRALQRWRDMRRRNGG